MTLKYKILLYLIALAAAFSFGRYSASRVTSKVISQSQISTNIYDNKNTHQVKVITKNPNGSETETITTDTADKSQELQSLTNKTAVITAISKASKLNLSVLVSNDFTKPSIVPLYGVSVQKEFLGPITIGGFGLTNGVVGVSIGLDF